jgi:hypothetical protein
MSEPTFRVGDNIFPPGDVPRSCIVCGQYETGRGWRMGFAKTAHGRMHVKDGNGARGRPLRAVRVRPNGRRSDGGESPR